MAVALSAVAWWWAEDRLYAEQHRMTEDMLHRTFTSSHDNDLYRDRMVFSDTTALAQSVPVYGYIFRRADQVTGVVFMPVIVRGYQSDIELAVGIDIEGAVTGVTVLSHGETPGLGDSIAHESFLGQFIDSDIGEYNLWNTRGDQGAYDAASGATISSRTVIHAVRDSLIFFTKVRPRILESSRS